MSFSGADLMDGYRTESEYKLDEIREIILSNNAISNNTLSAIKVSNIYISLIGGLILGFVCVKVVLK